MDEARAALLAKYAAAPAGTIFDPVLKAVAAQQFKGDKRKWPFSEIATFLSAPPRPGAAAEGFADLDVALVGVPMDLGVTNRAGARLGPRAVRQIERIGPWNRVLGVAPMNELRVADVGDVPMASRFDLARCHADIEAWFAQIAGTGVVPLAVGGDHSISRPILAALARKHGPIGLIHIDAHCDTSGEYEGSKFHHGGPFRFAVLEGSVDPLRTIQIGIRGGGDYLWEFSQDTGMEVIWAEQFAAMGVEAAIARVRGKIGKGPVYVSFDVDSLDPGFAPGTGTPEVGGLAPREVLALLRGLGGLPIIGGDVVEVAPQYDATTNTAQAAAQVLFELLCLVALTRRPKR